MIAERVSTENASVPKNPDVAVEFRKGAVYIYLSDEFIKSLRASPRSAEIIEGIVLAVKQDLERVTQREAS
jgi:hypothetical protein